MNGKIKYAQDRLQWMLEEFCREQLDIHTPFELGQSLRRSEFASAREVFWKYYSNYRKPGLVIADVEGVEIRVRGSYVIGRSEFESLEHLRLGDALQAARSYLLVALKGKI